LHWNVFFTIRDWCRGGEWKKRICFIAARGGKVVVSLPPEGGRKGVVSSPPPVTSSETLSKHLRRLGGGGDGRVGVGLRPPPLGAKLEY